jgi:hypothetical protein
LIPVEVTTTLAVEAGSCTDFPFNDASRFQGAPMRIQRRLETKRAVWPGCSVRSKTEVPLADPMCTDSQQRPRAAASTIRATVAGCLPVGGAGVGAGVVVRVVGGGGRDAAWG